LAWKKKKFGARAGVGSNPEGLQRLITQVSRRGRTKPAVTFVFSGGSNGFRRVGPARTNRISSGGSGQNRHGLLCPRSVACCLRPVFIDDQGGRCLRFKRQSAQEKKKASLNSKRQTPGRRTSASYGNSKTDCRPRLFFFSLRVSILGNCADSPKTSTSTRPVDPWGTGSTGRRLL